MKNRLWIDFEKNTIFMDRTFSAKCKDTRSEEYAHLQQVRQHYPSFSVVARKIKKNEKKETWAGLTYAYMENYIVTHEAPENRACVLAEYNELRLISECHKRSSRYPVIKKWFLAKYPEIAEFGIRKDEEEGSRLPTRNETELSVVDHIQEKQSLAS